MALFNLFPIWVYQEERSWNLWSKLGGQPVRGRDHIGSRRLPGRRSKEVLTREVAEDVSAEYLDEE